MKSTESIEVMGDPKVVEALSKILCPNCGKNTLRLEMRMGPLKVKPIGTFSLAGAQMKMAATMEAEGFLVCNDCGFEKKGKRDAQAD